MQTTLSRLLAASLISFTPYAISGVVDEATDYLGRNCGALQMFGGRVASQVTIDKDGEIFIPDTGEESARRDYKFPLKNGRFFSDDQKFYFVCDQGSEKCVKVTTRVLYGVATGKRAEDEWSKVTIFDKINPSMCSAKSIEVFKDLETHFRGKKPKTEKPKPRTRYD